MTPDRIIAIVLVIAITFATLRLLFGVWRSAAALRPRVWRVLALVVLQATAVALLYRTLLPPVLPVAAGTLVVATAGATRADLDAAAGDRVVALPDAGDLAGVNAVPDLATALRRHPQTTRVQVIGAGLEAHDRDALAGRAMAFSPSPAPRGIVALSAPDQVAPGQRFLVRGRIAGVDGARVELRDPADRRVAMGAPDDTGAFALDATTRIAGVSLYTLQLTDGDDAVIERLPVPVWTVAQAAPRVLLVAGAPNPDTKYLRRWADEAGITTRQRIEFGGGARVADAGTAIDPVTLAALDLVVFDARAFAGLGATQRSALRDAVQGGLGVLVHAPGSMSAALRTQLRAFGLEIAAAATATPLQLDPDTRDAAMLRARLGGGTRDAPFDAAIATEALPALAYRPLRGDGSAFAGLRGPADLALWQAWGQGRIGVTSIEDSWQLVTAGRADVHAELWSGWITTLARAGEIVTPRVAGARRVGQRMAVCDVASDAEVRVRAPDGTEAVLRVDPRADGCAAYWPRLSGWHHIVGVTGAERPFHVASSAEGSALHAEALRTMTSSLVRSAATTDNTALETPTRRGSPWPWFAAWLLAVAGLWALERSQVGRGSPRRGID